MKLAIIIGVSEYQHCNPLPACNNDIALMENIFKKLDKFEDICVIDNSPTGLEGKKKLTDFINKYKEKEVEELVFYYTGHGARYDDDFFYLFSDFKEDKKEVTGLRNTELDGLIRNLSPNLTVKIVDACYSGTTYVKSDSDNDIRPFLEKSAKDNSLKDLYFFHSSSSEETSLASPTHSCFTHSFCKALAQNEGLIRYRDIMAFIADDMNLSTLPKPTFIIQANNTEYFGELDSNFINYARKALELLVVDEDMADQPIEPRSPETNLLNLVELKSKEEYCSFEEASANIIHIKDQFKSALWPQEISDIFEIEETQFESHEIPNAVEIGKWIHKNIEENFFAEPSYEHIKYFENEYIETPKKPSATNSFFAAHIARSAALGFRNEKDYKLEKVEKRKSIINGFNYKADSPFRSLKLQFKPKYSALDSYSIVLVVLFSRKSLALFSAKEHLPYESWDCISEPKCANWKIKLVKLKNSEQISNYIKSLIVEMSNYITSDITQRLNN